MREILFRGKRIDNGEWVEGWLHQATAIREDCEASVQLAITAPYDKPFFREWYIIDPATVGQYTGMVDMNGAKIFEGDVLESIFTHLEYVVRFGDYIHYIGGDDSEEEECGFYCVDINGNVEPAGGADRWAIRRRSVHDKIGERREPEVKPTMEEADAIHREALAEQQDQFAASVMLGTRETSEDADEQHDKGEK